MAKQIKKALRTKRRINVFGLEHASLQVYWWIILSLLGDCLCLCFCAGRTGVNR